MVNFCGTKSVPPTSSIKMRNCQKKLARVYVHTRAYTQIRDRGGWLSPPPPLIGLISPASSHFNMAISILAWFPLKVTNLPYMVDEFLRQKILTSGTCTSTTCRFFQVSASQVPQPTFTREVGNLTGYQHHSHPLTSSVPTYLLDIPN